VTDPRDPFASEREEAERPAPTRPYSIAVGILFLAVIGFAAVSLLGQDNPGARGLQPGTNLPRFAAPSATGALEGDANVFQNREAAGEDHVPACEVPDRDAIRICDYFDRPLVLVAWFSKCGNCEDQLDIVDRVRRMFPKVAFVGLDVRDSQNKAREMTTRNGWGFPMAVDRDGAVSTLYNIGVGPTTFFAYPGGVLADTALGKLDEEELIRRVRELVRVSERRARVRAARARQ
jgi:thiol-disulfide isomerase/thioredoxin